MSRLTTELEVATTELEALRARVPAVLDQVCSWLTLSSVCEQLERALTEEKALHAQDVQKLMQQLEELHAEMASERALLQRMLDELQKQFDAATQRDG